MGTEKNVEVERITVVDSAYINCVYIALTCEIPPSIIVKTCKREL